MTDPGRRTRTTLAYGAALLRIRRRARSRRRRPPARRPSSRPTASRSRSTSTSRRCPPRPWSSAGSRGATRGVDAPRVTRVTFRRGSLPHSCKPSTEGPANAITFKALQAIAHRHGERSGFPDVQSIQPPQPRFGVSPLDIDRAGMEVRFICAVLDAADAVYDFETEAENGIADITAASERRADRRQTRMAGPPRNHLWADVPRRRCRGSASLPRPSLRLASDKMTKKAVRDGEGGFGRPFLFRVDDSEVTRVTSRGMDDDSTTIQVKRFPTPLWRRVKAYAAHGGSVHPNGRYRRTDGVPEPTRGHMSNDIILRTKRRIFFFGGGTRIQVDVHVHQGTDDRWRWSAEVEGSRRDSRALARPWVGDRSRGRGRRARLLRHSRRGTGGGHRMMRNDAGRRTGHRHGARRADRACREHRAPCGEGRGRQMSGRPIHEVFNKRARGIGHVLANRVPRFAGFKGAGEAYPSRLHAARRGNAPAVLPRNRHRRGHRVRQRRASRHGEHALRPRDVPEGRGSRRQHRHARQPHRLPRHRSRLP